MIYSNLTDEQKKDILIKDYIENKLSFYDIADKYSTYANKIRRDAKKFGIHIRSKAEAQKNALSSGKHKHPTKGSSRPEDIKNKIGASMVASWDAATQQTKDERAKKAKAQWEKLSEDIKQNMLKKANDAVRMSSKVGSKLEKFIMSCLIADGYSVDFHKEQILSNTKLQIDLFLPKIGLAIEIDGPSHFEPVWGEDSLSKNIEYDNKKNGLILGKGLYLIRVKQTQDFSKSRAKLVYEKVKVIIQTIIDNKQNIINRLFEIGDK